MFRINVKFLGQQPPRAAYSSMSIDEIYGYLSWEAELTITCNNQILFSEEVAIVEFYWYLVNWYCRYLTGKKDDFIYCSVEHTDPILVFARQQKHYWKIDSVWRQCDKPAFVKEEILYSEVHKLVEKSKLTIEA